MKNFLLKKIAILAGIVVLGLTFSSFKDDDKNFQVTKNLDVFNSIFKELDMFYVDTIKPDKSIRTGIDAMLEALDPYTDSFTDLPADMDLKSAPTLALFYLETLFR